MKPSLLLVGLSLFTVAGVAHYPSQHQSETALATTADCESAKGLDRIVCLADVFKATLSADQITTLQRSYSKTDAARWSNFPEFSARPRRVGVRLGTLNDTQVA